MHTKHGPNIRRCNLIIIDQQQALNHVLEFPYIPRPVIITEDLPDVLAQLHRSHSHIFAKLFHEIFRQNAYIGAQFPKRRHFDLQHVQPVEQVFPESLVFDQRLQPAIRGSNNPNVHGMYFLSTDLVNLPFLQYPEQFRLCLQRELRDLIQENCAAVSMFKQPFFRPVGAGESPFFVPEQFTFNQICGDAAAVNRHKVFVPSGTVIMQVRCHQFFASAGLAINEHTRVGMPDFVHLRQQLGHWF
ncbi:MAG: hypothetical protein MAGBODY4_01414 [Candidatus Marinimicrobia bacterium]|nr:hypothetical protein [Candidatus Neomarinimicrobiota bacterium]